MELPAQRLDLPRTPLSARSARLHTHAVCAAVGALPDDDPRSVVVELVTNALEHTEGPITLFWWVEDGQLLFAVTDDAFNALEWKTPRPEPDADAEDGRGLQMALVLADELAYGPTADGGKWIRAAFVLPESPDAEMLAARQRASLERPSWNDLAPAASYRNNAAAGDVGGEQSGTPPTAVTCSFRPILLPGSSRTLTTKVTRARILRRGPVSTAGIHRVSPTGDARRGRRAVGLALRWPVAVQGSAGPGHARRRSGPRLLRTCADTRRCARSFRGGVRASRARSEGA
ncbi:MULTISPECIES: ATP-binding protein [Streptomycetaceae]|uniref:ATP-binding protein n=1 Tax=Embleya scabrispora TaxID=159449 RepID=UPI001319C111|nr:hypothetical protein [Streptomyces sp. SID5474]